MQLARGQLTRWVKEALAGGERTVADVVAHLRRRVPPENAIRECQRLLRKEQNREGNRGRAVLSLDEQVTRGLYSFARESLRSCSKPWRRRVLTVEWVDRDGILYAKLIEQREEQSCPYCSESGSAFAAHRCGHCGRCYHCAHELDVPGGRWRCRDGSWHSAAEAVSFTSALL